MPPPIVTPWQTCDWCAATEAFGAPGECIVNDGSCPTYYPVDYSYSDQVKRARDSEENCLRTCVCSAVHLPSVSFSSVRLCGPRRLHLLRSIRLRKF